MIRDYLEEDGFYERVNVFGWKNVEIYWNMEDYPIPTSADLRSISHEIISSLRLVGCRGQMIFQAFGPNLREQHDCLVDAGFQPFNPEQYELFRIGKPEYTTFDEAIWRFILVTTHSPKVLVVISKQRPGSQLRRILECVQNRDAIFVVWVDPQGDPFPTTTDLFLERAQLLGRSKLNSMPRHGIREGFVECDPDGSVKYDPNSRPSSRMRVVRVKFPI